MDSRGPIAIHESPYSLLILECKYVAWKQTSNLITLLGILEEIFESRNAFCNYRIDCESTNPTSNPRIQLRIHESSFESSNPTSNPRIQLRIHESNFESTNPVSNPRIQLDSRISYASNGRVGPLALGSTSYTGTV